MLSIRSLVLACLLLPMIAAPSFAQVRTGTPPFGSFAGGPDVINLANNNVHWDFPIFTKAGRGTGFAYEVAYDSSVWTPVTSGSTVSWQPVTNWGWTGANGLSAPYIGLQITTLYCFGNGILNPPTGQKEFNLWTYLDQKGTTHLLGLTDSGTSGCGSTTTITTTAADGSGYQFSATGQSVNYLYDRKGTLINVPINPNPPLSGPYFTDRNGNELSVSGNSYIDTLGTTALTVGQKAPNPVSFSYTAPSGATATYTVKYSAFTVQTKFGCSNVNDYPATSNNLITEIDLPEFNSTTNPNARYTFAYEVTPGDTHNPHYVTGRIASVTLPTGGQVSYTYGGGSNGIVCADGSTASLQRTTPDGSWTYAHSESGTQWTTLVTDPANNQANLTFQGIYPTERQAYSGSASSGTLLHTWIICYNGNTSNCNTTTIGPPILQRTVTDQFGSSGLQSQHNYFYNLPGGLIEEDDIDYGSGAPGALLRKMLITYASLGNVTLSPQTVTVCNGSGSSSNCKGASGSSTGTMVAQTNYSYDQGALQSTSGLNLPQHVSVSGSRGNLTSISYPVSSLTANFAYYDTGSVYTTQDVNNATTTYNYSGNTADCEMAFPTSITEPAVAIGSMTQSYAWNCTGGVMTQLTDENNQTVATSYTDPYYWRPASITDQTNIATNFCYAALTSSGCPSTPSQTQIETYLNTFNSGTSTSDSLTTLDGLSRVHIQQTRQGPDASNSNFDSVETDYDVFGRPTRLTVPYVGTAGQTCVSCPATTTTYDPLSRVSQTKDGGGGTVSFTYATNSDDVVVALGPAPSGENLKQRQLEYDGFGRLTSVCEISSALAGYGTCGQQTSQSGYWTKYTYDVLGDLLTVTQNAQASSGSQQTRSYSFDAMGRLTSETNPETGTSSYTYDSISSGTCAGTYDRDLIKRVDAIGNITCYTYDALHRPLSRTYTVTSPTISTATKNFVYDSASVNSVNMAYAKTRLAEAYTGSSSSKITDEGFSYTQRGELTTVYELTPHSSPTYYQVSQTYWPNHAPNVLSGNIGLPTSITYGVEGEGRLSTVSASSGQNPVSSTTYNMYASNKLTVNFGSGDSDVFSYDPNTMRMVKYQFNIGTSTVTGSLGWNTNGTLSSLNISDPFNTANTQNCTFNADDLARISRVNCGTVWGQNFSYDPFGNIQKTVISGDGGTSFTPTYVSSPSTNNRISSVNGTNATYDANGNSLNDTFRIYTWDAENRPVTIGSVNLVYDALGRAVEQGTSSTYSEIVYSPTDVKLALMNGTILAKAFVPLPAGDTAVYTSSSGPAYYRHTDHLGSSRFASTTSQTLYADYAYSPFGEPYAQSGSIDPSFTGQNQDAMAGLYDFLYREHDPNQARWTQPDRAGRLAASLSNPQSWNRYAYILNNPLALVDPLGLTPISGSTILMLGNCTEDGFSVPCTMTSADLTSGGAVACPNNACIGFQTFNGGLVSFQAFADGSSGYLPLDSPAGYSPLDIANASSIVSQYANGTAIDPSQLTGRALQVYNLLTQLGVDPDDITIYQTGTDSFSAILTDEGFDQLEASDLVDSNAGDVFLHYPYTDGARSDQQNPSLHFVWFDENLTDYVGGSGVYMDFHADSSNPWNGGFWQHWGCDVFHLIC